jgi:hypothetical protein
MELNSDMVRYISRYPLIKKLCIDGTLEELLENELLLETEMRKIDKWIMEVKQEPSDTIDSELWDHALNHYSDLSFLAEAIMGVINFRTSYSHVTFIAIMNQHERPDISDARPSEEPSSKRRRH